MQPLDPSRVLFEDADILVVNKPPGLPIHPTIDPARENLWGQAREYLKGEYLGLHHRLDRDCSGAVVFTKSKRANPGMANAFLNRTVQKKYVSIVEGTRPLKKPLGKEFVEIQLQLKKVRVHGIGRMQVVPKGGDLAITRLAREGSLVRAELITGRMHQIRVTLSWLGCPILGDTLYGMSKSNPPAPRLMLHAETLAFPHPITGAAISVTAPIPPDFQIVLKSLQRKG